MKGLTLIEVLVAAGISAVAGVLLIVIILNSANFFKDQSSKVTTGLNFNDAFSEIRRGIKEASVVSDQSNPEILVLKVLSQDSSGNIIENTYDDFIFTVEDTYLRFKILPDSQSFRTVKNQILAGNVDSIKFQYFNSAAPPSEVIPQSAGKVRITLNVKTTVATAEANLRND